jgi:hypothetical protein
MNNQVLVLIFVPLLRLNSGDLSQINDSLFLLLERLFIELEHSFVSIRLFV